MTRKSLCKSITAELLSCFSQLWDALMQLYAAEIVLPSQPCGGANCVNILGGNLNGGGRLMCWACGRWNQSGVRWFGWKNGYVGIFTQKVGFMCCSERLQFWVSVRSFLMLIFFQVNLRLDKIFMFISCILWLMSMIFLFLSQSKEMAFQLQEDLMKVLNELYTVSTNHCLFIYVYLDLDWWWLMVLEYIEA